MPDFFITVCERDDENPVELPLEVDQTLSLPTLKAQFPNCTGLKYKSPDSGCFRGLRLVNDRIYPPESGWDGTLFHCVFPKDDTNSKRKCETNGDAANQKLRRLDGKKCTDLIVLNLAWHTDEAKLRSYFSQFGDVAMIQIKRDHGTQRSRGYAFIRFCDYAGQLMCLAEKHVIDNRTCEVRIPLSKGEGDRQEIGRKIHVSRLNDDVTVDLLRDHFSQYGRVIDVFIPKPFRGFAFVTFEDFDAAASLVGMDMEIDGCQVTISSAAPKLPPNARNKAANNQQTAGNGGGQPGAQDSWTGKASIYMPSFPGWPYSTSPHPFSGDGSYRQQQQQQQASGHSSPSSMGFSMGMHPAAAAAAAALAAQYTSAHQRQNAAGDRGQPPATNPSSVESNAIAAFATLNILNNPNVVAAIVNAATNASHQHQSAVGGRGPVAGSPPSAVHPPLSAGGHQMLPGQQAQGHSFTDGCR